MLAQIPVGIGSVAGCVVCVCVCLRVLTGSCLENNWVSATKPDRDPAFSFCRGSPGWGTASIMESRVPNQETVELSEPKDKDNDY